MGRQHVQPVSSPFINGTPRPASGASYTVSLFRPGWDGDVWNFLDPAPLGYNERSDQWFVYLQPEHYSPDVGLRPPRGMDPWLV